MSIKDINIHTYSQKFDLPKHYKMEFGAVNTDFKLVNQILNLLPLHLFADPTLKWLDPCVGSGYFSMVLYKRLFVSLQTQIKSPIKRHNHIINNMIWMIELNTNYIPTLYEIFGENANIICGDFLEYSNLNFDIIIGNPPFNSNGIKKVPTQKKYNKKTDGKTIWPHFIQNCIVNLKGGGYLAMITPSIWMKRDHSLFNYMTQWKLLNVNCMTSTETNAIFHKQAQTPTCFFALTKQTNTPNDTLIWDKALTRYVPFPISQISIPLIAPSIINRLLKWVNIYGHISVIKTSMRPDYKGMFAVNKCDKEHSFPNISTCRLNKATSQLIVNYSNKKYPYYGVPKLVLAHKMYGFPYHDKTGKYGISNRDNYVILNKTPQQFKQLQAFLSSKLAFVAYESTRYRMRFLERYAFEFLPDISVINSFPTNITDETILDYFNFNDLERKFIMNITNKNYTNSFL